MSYKVDPAHPLTVAYPYFPEHERDLLHQDLEEILTGKLSLGPRTAKFEQEFAKFCGSAHGVTFHSCTAALEAALTALGAGPGDEILVPVETFIATGSSVQAVGATPVFVEIDPDTFNMDFQDALSRVSRRTKGAIVVHFGGYISPRLPGFIQEMKKRGLFVVEDAAHAHGAELGRNRAGSLGDAACFSFYPTKIMTTGEGGMLVTSQDSIAEVARSLQNRGRDMKNPIESYVIPGRNNRFTEIAAAMGLSQLRCLPEFLQTRRKIGEIYNRLLVTQGRSLFHALQPQGVSVSSYWRYTALPRVSIDRVRLRDKLATDGITIDWAYDPPLHLQPVFRTLYGTHPGMLPRSEEILNQHICLPVHARLRSEDAEFVIHQLLKHTEELATNGE